MVRHFDAAQCGSKCGELVEPLRSPLALSEVEGLTTENRLILRQMGRKLSPKAIFLPGAYGKKEYFEIKKANLIFPMLMIILCSGIIAEKPHGLRRKIKDAGASFEKVRRLCEGANHDEPKESA